MIARSRDGSDEAKKRGEDMHNSASSHTSFEVAKGSVEPWMENVKGLSDHAYRNFGSSTAFFGRRRVQVAIKSRSHPSVHSRWGACRREGVLPAFNLAVCFQGTMDAGIETALHGWWQMVSNRYKATQNKEQCERKAFE